MEHSIPAELYLKIGMIKSRPVWPQVATRTVPVTPASYTGNFEIPIPIVIMSLKIASRR